MAESFAQQIFPKQYAKIDRLRKTVTSHPLQMKDITTLMSMRFNGKQLFDSIDQFFSEEYKKALQDKIDINELEKIEKFRPATDREANLLFNDLHMRDEKEEYTGGGAQSE